MTNTKTKFVDLSKLDLSSGESLTSTLYDMLQKGNQKGKKAMKKGRKNFKFTFRDENGAYHPLPPRGTSKLRVITKDAYRSLALADLPLEVIRQLAAEQIKTIITKTLSKKAVDEDYLLQESEAVFNSLKGNIQIKNGLVIQDEFDADMWRDVALRVASKKGMKPHPQSVEKFISSLQSMSEAVRATYIQQLQGDPQFFEAIKEAEIAAHKTKKGGDMPTIDAGKVIFQTPL